LAEAFVERVGINVLDGGWAAVAAIEFPSPLSFSYVNPIGGAVTGPREAILFDEGFKQ
jgi:hypothetical protein